MVDGRAVDDDHSAGDLGLLLHGKYSEAAVLLKLLTIRRIIGSHHVSARFEAGANDRVSEDGGLRKLGKGKKIEKPLAICNAKKSTGNGLTPSKKETFILT